MNSTQRKRTETSMAVVNYLNCPKPFFPLLAKPKTPNINSVKFNRKIPNQSSKFRFTIVVVNGTLKNSGQNTPGDDEAESLGVKAALSVLKFYKREISPLLPKSCRFVPTCSEYSMEAYKKYGFAKGTVLTTWRICRCNPLGGSGFDPPRWFDEEKPTEE